MNPIISVIVPCYNQEQYLSEALNSVLAQTLKNWECIIVNDGSTDNSLRIAKEYAQSDKRFIVIDISNGGLANARNTGIKASHGEYILPLDSDDKIGSTYLEKALNQFRENSQLKLVYCLAEFFDKESGIWNLPNYEYSKLLWNNLIFCSCVFRKSDYDKTPGYNTNMKYGHEDWDFLLSLLNDNDIISCIPEVLFYYRKHGDSMINDTHQRMYLANTQMIKNHWELYEPFIADMFEYRKTKFDYELSLKWNEHLEKELNGILNSKAYKLGKLLLKPVSFIRDLLKL